MSHSAALASLAGIALLVGASLVVGPVGGPVAASPQPTPVCSVCGQTFHENVTATEASLQVRENGDVHWHVENELSDPTASRWREDPEAAERRVREAVDSRTRPPYDPTGPTVEVDGDSVVVEFVDRGAARQRLGLLVVPYLHGEDVRARWAINADEFVVAAPSGQRIVNDPAGGTLEGDRVTWNGVASVDDPDPMAEAWEAPEPGDTYVVVGSGPTADERSVVATGLMPLDGDLYGKYAVGLVIVVGLTLGIYGLRSHRLGPSRVGVGVAGVSLPYLALVLSTHPPQLGGPAVVAWLAVGVLVTTLLGLVGGSLLYVWSAVSEDPGSTEVT